MTPEERNKVSELFHAAREREPDKRDLFLEEACDDEQIRAEVRSLLDADEKKGDFLKWPLLGPPQVSKPPAIDEAVYQKLGERYEILGEAGRGGMGIVYKARDRETKDIVAIKALKSDVLADPVFLERFKNEMRLARKITHKNVCRIYHFHPIGNTAYISMEFVEGESLREVLQRFGGLSVRKGIDVGLQICDGLQEVHNQKVVHRDLKPGNIMIDRSGNVKVLDFGIARSVESGASPGTALIGTPSYMAPEQVLGKAIDERTDIYALGLILYEVFTGHRAFTGDEISRKQLEEKPRPPHELEPSIPAEVEKVILQCLEKKPDDRYQSLAELRLVLSKGSSEIQEPSPPPVPTPPRPAWTRRAAMLGVLLPLFLYVGFSLGRNWTPPVSNIRHESTVWALSFSPDGKKLASASEDKTVKIWDPTTQRQLRLLSGHTRAVTSLEFGPEGRLLVSASSDKTVRIWNTDSGKEIQTLTGHAQPLNCVAYSPDGQRVASGSMSGRLNLWDIETGQVSRSLVGHTAEIRSVAFSPDGKLLASGGYDEKVVLWDVTTGEAVRTITGHSDWVEKVTFSPDGRWLASAGLDLTVKIWEVATGSEYRSLAGHTDWIINLAFSPDGTRLASASDDGTARIWDVASGRQIQTIEAGRGPVKAVAFNSNGNQLALGFSGGAIEIRSINE